MTTTLAERDPLEPNLLPASWEHEISTDVGSDARPFGLTLTTVVPESEIANITGVHYDHDRQITVTPDGDPLTAHPLVGVSTTTTRTKADNQTWPDKDPDD